MFRYTIRDVLWLAVVAALAVGWWIDHRRAKRMEFQYVDLSQRFTSLVEQLEARGISQGNRVLIALFSWCRGSKRVGWEIIFMSASTI